VAAQRNRPRITVTIDPGMLEEVDAYIQAHNGIDRSQVIDEALRCWYAHQIREALIEQHSADRSSEESEERLAWRRVRAAAVSRLERKYDEAEEG
jgi:metal-responsive CopG/Arc/MetJ family transcriptional regulator